MFPADYWLQNVVDIR